MFFFKKKKFKEQIIFVILLGTEGGYCKHTDRLKRHCKN
jgi:hypothetical protein